MSKTVTSKEAAQLLGYSVSYVTTHLLQTGSIKAEKVGGRWQVDLESIEAYERPVNVRPKVNSGRIIPIKKDYGSKADNRVIIQKQIEAVRAGKVKPLVLERGVSSI